MKKTLAFLLISAAVTNAAAQTTPDTVALDPLVVTATRLPQPLSKVAASVTVITGDQLRRAGIHTVADALRSVTGAAVVRGGSYGATTSLFLRGGESDYVQVLLDGVQINSPGEQFNWSNLTIEDIDRIEVVKGPASVLYGSDAVTGVVQLFTRAHAGKPAGELSVMGGQGPRVGADADGSFNNLAVRGDIAGGNSRFGYGFGISHFDSEGAYAFNNDHRSTSITARAQLQPGSATRLAASLRYGSSEFHYPTNGTGQLVDQNQHQLSDLLALGADLSHIISPRVELALGVRLNQNDDQTTDLPDNAADTLGFFRFESEQQYRRRDIDARVNYRLGSANTITVGSEIEWQASTGSSSHPFGGTPETTDERNNRALYGQWLGDIARLSLQLGARVEDNDKFGTAATYRGGVAYRVTDNLRARASAGTAFKEPRFFEQFASGFVRGNPNLEPERSRSIEAALDGVVRGARVTAAIFHQQFQDLIQYVAAAAPPTPNYTNVAGARASGLELNAEHAWNRFILAAGYTLLATEVTDDGDGNDSSFREGEQLLRRPRHSASLRVTGNAGPSNFGLTANHVGERADLNFASFPATRVTLPSYVRIDAHVGYRLNRSFVLTAKVENTLDEQYQEVLNFPAPGRVIYVGGQVGF